MKIKAINIENINDIREIQSQMKNANMEDIPSSDSLNKALEDAKERQKLYAKYDMNKEKILMDKYDIKPRECHNEPCKFCEYNEYLFCNNKKGLFMDCRFRLLEDNPNDLDYDEEYLPTWQEALDLLSKNGLIKEDTREECKKASLYYNKAKTQDERNETEIKGITMIQAQKGIETAIKEYFDCIKDNYFSQEEFNKFMDHIDISVIASNSTLEFEKAMGIYPNIKIR